MKIGKVWRSTPPIVMEKSKWKPVRMRVYRVNIIVAVNTLKRWWSPRAVLSILNNTSITRVEGINK